MRPTAEQTDVKTEFTAAAINVLLEMHMRVGEKNLLN